MHINKIFDKSKTTLSFEFFPPKNENSNIDLFNTISSLKTLDPSFVSVTYGAGGSTREFTHALVIKLTKETAHTVIPHLTCIGHTKDEIFDIIKSYYDVGIENIMALRGDPPGGGVNFTPTLGGFTHAFELVKFIKSNFPNMGIGVAAFPEGHPETPNRLLEIEYLKQKVDAGADYICSQMFFDNNSFYDFCERCNIANITIPIIAGIMPITTIKGMKRMAELALGANIPAKLLRSLYRADGEDYVENVGRHWATEQVRDLIDNGVDGIHFYTLNKSSTTKAIYESVGLKNTGSLNST